MVSELFVVGDPTAKHWIKEGQSLLPPNSFKDKVSPSDGNINPTISCCTN
jgi:hypothetical protein